MEQVQEATGSGKLNDYIKKMLLCAKGCYTLKNLDQEVKTSSATLS